MVKKECGGFPALLPLVFSPRRIVVHATSSIVIVRILVAILLHHHRLAHLMLIFARLILLVYFPSLTFC